MNAKTEQKERSHETILESAARLIRQRGIGGARVADVMQGAGLTVGGFYAHFASKQALVDETLHRTGQEVRERLFANLDSKPPRARAEVILKRYLSVAHRDEALRGCPLPAVVGEVGTTAAEHRQALSAQVEAMTAELEAQLAPGAGAIGRPELALGLVALMYGGLSLARALGNSELSGEVLRACRLLGSSAAAGKPRQ
jgi:TetR/AcrR family transcriptional regulator, transcriptional repressor for nem operon